jgi:regulator of RNase E activity RraA
MFSVNPDAGPVVGYAVTAAMRSFRPAEFCSDKVKSDRLRYYEYVSKAAGPKVALMQDLDGAQRGVGPFWGEFNSRIHRALGCVAIITDGSIRDLDNLPPDILILSAGPRPSHSYVHVTEFGRQVNIFGMYVRSGDLVHADRHGAVTFDPSIADEVAAKAVDFVNSERDILEACRRDQMDFETLKTLYMRR